MVKRLACFLLMILLGAALAAAPASAGGQFEFTLLKDGSGYELTAYTGTSAVVIIPAEYEDLPVKKIGDRAFTEAKDLRMFLTEQGQATFYAEDGVLFTDDPVKTLVRFPNAWKQDIASYMIPEGTEAIAPWAFSGCETLAYLHIPEGVVSIGDYAFAECNTHTLNLMVFCPASLKDFGTKLLQNQKANVAFLGQKNIQAAKYAQKNKIPYGCYLEDAVPAETTVTETRPDFTEAEDPGMPESPRIAKVNDIPHVQYTNFMPVHFDLSGLQQSRPDEIRIPLKEHWREIALKEEGKTDNGYPPQTGLYGIGYTEEEMILRGYDAEGNVCGVRRVNGDFVYALPGACDLGVSGGKKSHVTAVPYEPTVITEPGVLAPKPESFYTGTGTCLPFRIFILQYDYALVDSDYPPQADGISFSMNDSLDTPNGCTRHYTIAMIIQEDPYNLDSTELVTLTFHRIETRFENEEFRFRVSPRFTKATEDYGEKLYEVLKKVKEVMIGTYYPADGPVSQITVSLNGLYPSATGSEIFLDEYYEQYSKKNIETYAHEMVHAIDQSAGAFEDIAPSSWTEGRAVYISEKVCKAMKAESQTRYSKKDLAFMTDEDKADFARFFCESGSRETAYVVGYLFVKYLCAQYGEDILARIEDNINRTEYTYASNFTELFRECVTSVTDPDVFQNFIRDMGL